MYLKLLLKYRESFDFDNVFKLWRQKQKNVKSQMRLHALI